MTSTLGIRSIAAYEAAAAKLSEGTPERNVADLQVAELLYLQRVQEAAQTISQACSRIDWQKDGCVNPDRPYLTWTCCDTHRALKVEKERLLKLAADLGETLELDAINPIGD